MARHDNVMLSKSPTYGVFKRTVKVGVRFVCDECLHSNTIAIRVNGKTRRRRRCGKCGAPLSGKETASSTRERFIAWQRYDGTTKFATFITREEAIAWNEEHRKRWTPNPIRREVFDHVVRLMLRTKAPRTYKEAFAELKSLLSAGYRQCEMCSRPLWKAQKKWCAECRVVVKREYYEAKRRIHGAVPQHKNRGERHWNWRGGRHVACFTCGRDAGYYSPAVLSKQKRFCCSRHGPKSFKSIGTIAPCKHCGRSAGWKTHYEIEKSVEGFVCFRCRRELWKQEKEKRCSNGNR